LQIVFPAARVALALVFLFFASWSDYKNREVSNRVWMLLAPSAVLLTLAELLIYESARLPWFGLVLGVTTGFALLLFYAGAFGGADSKALICIALALPFFPSSLLDPVFVGGLSPIAQNFFPFTIFSNSVLVAAGSVIVMLIVNAKQRVNTGKQTFEGTLKAESVWKKILVLMTGYKTSLERLQEKWHIYPMEDIVEEESNETALKRKLVIMPKDEGRQEILDRLSRAIATGRIDSHIFATPGLPMLVFMTLGMIISLFFGDIVWLLIRFIFG
jgi:preflagellin peptidase FlaK